MIFEGGGRCRACGRLQCIDFRICEESVRKPSLDFRTPPTPFERAIFDFLLALFDGKCAPHDWSFSAQKKFEKLKQEFRA